MAQPKVLSSIFDLEQEIERQFRQTAFDSMAKQEPRGNDDVQMAAARVNASPHLSDQRKEALRKKFEG